MVHTSIIAIKQTDKINWSTTTSHVIFYILILTKLTHHVQSAGNNQIEAPCSEMTLFLTMSCLLATSIVACSAIITFLVDFREQSLFTSGMGGNNQIDSPCSEMTLFLTMSCLFATNIVAGSAIITFLVDFTSFNLSWANLNDGRSATEYTITWASIRLCSRLSWNFHKTVIKAFCCQYSTQPESDSELNCNSLY